VQAAAAHLGDAPVLVLNGDVPLVTAEALSDLIEAHTTAAAQATIASMELEDPAGYGRVVRRGDGSVERVVETKVAGDATDEELAEKAQALADLASVHGRIACKGPGCNGR
jgi:bifunctional UDP-N-acetylglucosamine pyrophosphorylase/glucosamine-1-phosphate N-acetyltransferase